jgi:hypothetical protein
VDNNVLKTTNPNSFEHQLKSKWVKLGTLFKNQREKINKTYLQNSRVPWCAQTNQNR